MRVAIAPIRERPSGPGGPAEAPVGNRQQHYAAVRCEPSTIKGGCDFLGLNSWKRERGVVSMWRGWRRNQVLRRISALHHARQPSTRPLVNNIRRAKAEAQNKNAGKSGVEDAERLSETFRAKADALVLGWTSVLLFLDGVPVLSGWPRTQDHPRNC
jgi:hypothetical protein